MSVVGFDVGNESGVVAVARQRGIDVVLNDESKRETPAIVCFGEKQRFLGTAGAASSMMNPKNTISQIKRFIGRKFSDPELQKDIKSLPFSVSEGHDGYPLIHAQYLGENRTFTPTQLLGMVLSDLKIIAEKNLNSAFVDCCIGIPVYFTDLQRRAVIDAATIAGLHPLHLIHETTATALAYGIYKTDLPENEPMIVAFVDVGHASMQVCIAAFKKGQLKILAHSYDQCLGGRDFDEVLFQHFAATFKEEYKIDVYQNARACLRLRAACEKLKKMLSTNPEAPLNIECLMDEKDVRGFIKRDEFEQISIPILERVRKPLEKALADAGLSTQDIHSVEVVGSGSRVPAIIKILTEFFGKEPRRTMNASECVAKGSALQCAILSPTFKVRDFQVNESFPFSIALSWKGSASDTQNGAADNQQSTVVFPRGNPVPSIKALTFYRSGTFTVDVQYADASELQTPPKISTYTIGPFQSTKGERAKLNFKVRLNLHGIVSVESAVLLEEEEVEVPVVKEAAKEGTKMETDDAHPSSIENDVNMQDAKADGPGAENGVSESGDKTSQMETDKVEAPKKKVKKTNVPVSEIIHGGLAAYDVQKAVEKEFEMALQDRVMEETKDKKNAVEAYVYDMRNKLHDKYHEFVTESDRDQLISRLQEVEDWLYEDGEDETKGVYIAKLDELKKQGDPIEERFKEHSERGTVINQLIYCINSYREAAMSNDSKFDHIDLAEKQKVLSDCVEAEAWLREKQQHQDTVSTCHVAGHFAEPSRTIVNMSVVGFDVGNESGVVAVARQKGINVVLNDESKLETPAVVCFGKKQRFLGTASMMNPKYTISQIKRFIGRKFSDAELQKDIKSLPFSVTEGRDGYPLIHAQYLGENRTFTPTQLLGMILSDLKIIAEKNLNSAVVDCCIGIPVYFTDRQRRAVIDAAANAGLNPLHLIHETTATALAYGIRATNLPENEPINVAFVDVGYASMQVCVAAFKKGQLKILAHSYDQCLCGRAFDEVLFQHFAAKFKDEYMIDVYRNARASLRLRAACEKLKKVLSENAEASLYIKCLMDEKDVIGFMKRDDFEQISSPILERVRMPLEKVLAYAQLSTQDIHSVEVVGSGSRVPMITKVLTEFFGKEPRQTMNASQCVAEGSALQCANLSPSFKVQDFQIIEGFPFPIFMSWNMPAPDDTQTGAADLRQSVLVFHPYNRMPSVKAVALPISCTFTIDVHYMDGSEPLNISTYTFGPFKSTKGENIKVKVKMRMNLHGIFSIESAMVQLIEGGYMKVPVVKEPAKEVTEMDVHPSSTETNVNTQDAKTDGPGAENGVPESGDKTSQMEMLKNMEARLEGLAMAMEDQAARTSAIEAKFDNLAAIQKLQFDLINEQIAGLGSRIGLKESTSCTAAEESTTLPYQQTVGGLPKFDGSDALAWLASADHYFLVHKTPMEKRVELVLTALSGPTMSWIKLLLRRNPDIKWDQFTDELLIRFGSEPTLDGYESLRTTSQKGALDDYITEFEGRLAQLPELTEKQYLGFFLGGLNPQIRMQIYDPTTITTYTAALKMAKHIDSLFKCMRDEECKRRKVVDHAESIHGGLAASDVQKAVKEEFEMALQDCVMEETKDKKNAVQAYIYDMRNKLHHKYYEFVAESDRNQLISRLQEVEDWLYEDGKDETKGVYIAKLDELKKQGDLIEERFKEHSMRVSVIDQFIYCINSYREAAMSNDSKFDHINLAEKLNVLGECLESEAWLREKQQHQDTLPKYTPPVLLSADVRKKAESLDRFCRPIMTKPAAKPSAPEPSSAFWR